MSSVRKLNSATHVLHTHYAMHIPNTLSLTSERINCKQIFQWFFSSVNIILITLLQMLFFTVAILLCAVRDVQCKTSESPSESQLVGGEPVGYFTGVAEDLNWQDYRERTRRRTSWLFYECGRGFELTVRTTENEPRGEPAGYFTSVAEDLNWQEYRERKQVVSLRSEFALN